MSFVCMPRPFLMLLEGLSELSESSNNVKVLVWYNVISDRWVVIVYGHAPDYNLTLCRG